MLEELQYKLIRSRRRTLSILVADGKITVRAPLRMADDAIMRFVESKRQWIEKQVARRDPRFDAVREGRALLCGGELFPVCFGAERNGEDKGTFYFKSEAAVRSYLIRTRGGELLRKAGGLAGRFGFSPSQILLRDFKARWGSCDSSGIIKLNWRLLMLPPELSGYVIVHELCHLKVLAHSPAFWEEVGRLCADWRRLRRELKNYAFLTNLYRR